MKEKHAQAVRDFLKAEQGQGDNDELRLSAGELQSAIFRTPKRISTPGRLGSSIKLLKSKWINQFDIERST